MQRGVFVEELTKPTVLHLADVEGHSGKIRITSPDSNYLNISCRMCTTALGWTSLDKDVYEWTSCWRMSTQETKNFFCTECALWLFDLAPHLVRYQVRKHRLPTTRKSIQLRNRALLIAEQGLLHAVDREH